MFTGIGAAVIIKGCVESFIHVFYFNIINANVIGISKMLVIIW